MNTDFVVDISDKATDNLLVLFNTEAGHQHLRERMGVPQDVVDQLCSFGYSSICNVLAAIKVAKQQGLGPKDVIATVATDGAGMYASEIDGIVARDHRGTFDAAAAGEVRAPLPRRRGHGPHARVHARGPAAHVQPGLLHLGRAAGRHLRRVHRARRARTSGSRPARS